MKELFVDLAVIGSGPAGQKGAIQAAKLGKSVALVEKEPYLGGTSLNWGTIPSKSLREAIVELTRFHERSFYGGDIAYGKISIEDLNFRLNKTIEEERNVLRRQFRKNGIRLIEGIASFQDPNTLVVGEEIIRAEKILIATGSKPRNPTNVPFDSEVILDSTRLLHIQELPESLLVLGGGIIGSEYASFFAALGVKVQVIDKRSHMLPLLDSEIGIHLQTHLTELGLKFSGRRIVEQIRRVGNEASIAFAGGETMRAEKLLFALGRVANVDPLNLSNAGIELTDRGYIPVNSDYQTAQSHIYACGDVIAGPALASTSMEQGRLAARHAFGLPTREFPKIYPLGIYTIPEISCVGQTEDDLQLAGIDYEVGRAYYYEIARGHITGSLHGLIKILFDRKTYHILGVHIIGRGAAELVHIGQVAMTFNATIDYFINQVFNYPTFAEGYRIAALNGMNKIARMK